MSSRGSLPSLSKAPPRLPRGATDHFGFVAQEIGAFRAAGVTIPLIAGASNDLMGVTIGNSPTLQVREVI
jgi:hypothetical protein